MNAQDYTAWDILEMIEDITDQKKLNMIALFIKNLMEE